MGDLASSWDRTVAHRRSWQGHGLWWGRALELSGGGWGREVLPGPGPTVPTAGAGEGPVSPLSRKGGWASCGFFLPNEIIFNCSLNFSWPRRRRSYWRRISSTNKSPDSRTGSTAKLRPASWTPCTWPRRSAWTPTSSFCPPLYPLSSPDCRAY